MNNKRKTITQKRWQNFDSPLPQKPCNPRKKIFRRRKATWHFSIFCQWRKRTTHNYRDEYSEKYILPLA